MLLMISVTHARPFLFLVQVLQHSALLWTLLPDARGLQNYQLASISNFSQRHSRQ